MATFAQSFPPHPDKNVASPDAAFGTSVDATQGVFAIASTREREAATFHYFVTDLNLLPALHEAKQAEGYDAFYFTHWTKDLISWQRLRPRAPIKGVLTLPEQARPSKHPPSGADDASPSNNSGTDASPSREEDREAGD